MNRNYFDFRRAMMAAYRRFVYRRLAGNYEAFNEVWPHFISFGAPQDMINRANGLRYFRDVNYVDQPLADNEKRELLINGGDLGDFDGPVLNNDFPRPMPDEEDGPRNRNEDEDEDDNEENENEDEIDISNENEDDNESENEDDEEEEEDLAERPDLRRINEAMDREEGRHRVEEGERHVPRRSINRRRANEIEAPDEEEEKRRQKERKEIQEKIKEKAKEEKAKEKEEEEEEIDDEENEERIQDKNYRIFFENMGYKFHEKCCVCLQIKIKGVKVLPCLHMVCRVCLIKILNNGQFKCPICKDQCLDKYNFYLKNNRAAQMMEMYALDLDREKGRRNSKNNFKQVVEVLREKEEKEEENEKKIKYYIDNIAELATENEKLKKENEEFKKNIVLVEDDEENDDEEDKKERKELKEEEERLKEKKKKFLARKRRKENERKLKELEEEERKEEEEYRKRKKEIEEKKEKLKKDLNNP